MLARHFVHGPQYGLVTNPAPAERQHEFHAADALWILRCFSHAVVTSALAADMALWTPLILSQERRRTALVAL
jgi:hypothetical protein